MFLKLVIFALLLLSFSSRSFAGNINYNTYAAASIACNSFYIAATSPYPGLGCNYGGNQAQFVAYQADGYQFYGRFCPSFPGVTSCTVYTFTHVGCSNADPVTGECIPPVKDQGQGACPVATADTNPINLGVGNKYQVETDYLGNSVFPLMVRRTFNSVSAVWQFHPQINAEADLSKAAVVRADGKKLTFPSDGVGGWTADPDVTGTLESIKDTSGNITSWRYTTLSQQVEDYDAAGQLTSITHRSGLSHTYTHTATDITVAHSEGGTLVYQLDTEGRITGFTDPDTTQYVYGYDIEGHLKSITYPNSGGSRIYHYEDTTFLDALTGITDANGDRFATWGYDNQGRAISSEHNNGTDLVTIDYAHLDDAIDPRATATNPLGKQTTYHFTTIHGVRKVTQVEGHPSNNCAAANKAYTYDTTNGFLETKTDWKGHVTRYTRNAKGQELTRIEAENTPAQRTITTDWHATFNVPTKITESDRETTFTYDPNGNRLTRVVSFITP